MRNARGIDEADAIERRRGGDAVDFRDQRGGFRRKAATVRRVHRAIGGLLGQLLEPNQHVPDLLQTAVRRLK